MSNIIDYIKESFPKVVFNPINMGALTDERKALGFVITDNKFVIGYIAENGNFCKVINPIDLNNIDSEHFIELLKSVPKVEGYNESDLTNFIKLMEESGKMEIVKRDQVISELQSKVKEFQEKESLGPNILVNSEGEKLLIKAEYTKELNNIKEQYEQELQKEKDDNQQCKDHLIYEKDIIIDAIKKYKNDINDYVNDSKNNIKENYQKIIDKLTNEKDIIETKLKTVLENENKHLDNLTEGTDFDYRLEQKNDEIKKLNETVTLIKNELDTIKEEYSKSEIENKLIQNHQIECLDHILSEKDLIIRNIKDYTKEWLDWSDKNDYSVEEYRKKLGIQVTNVVDNLNQLMKRKNDYVSSLNLDNKTKNQQIIELTNSIDAIKKELQKSATEQLTAMSLKDTPDNVSEAESDKLKIEISELKRELEHVKSLLSKNNNTPIKKVVDYSMCFETFTKFVMVNNMFYRKKQVIDILDKIIMDPTVISVFTNLSERIQLSIKNKYTIIRTEIYKHIDFLNLSKYMNDPNVHLFKSKSTWSKIPEQFCQDLQSISEYWDANILEYREQDRQLTNIFEDLSGALRIYIKIKPLIGIEQANNTVYIETVQNKKTKQVTVDCSGVQNLDLEIKKQTYGDFYGIFDKYFTNLDVYTGVLDSKPKGEFTVDIDSIIEEADTVNPGLYSSFKQVEDGYSIVLFGYGISGSGKTRILLGERGIPGLMHYGLANLKGVTNIRVKNVFEQYINKFTPTLKSISGNIHHLVGNIKQLKTVSFDESSDFSDNIPVGVNLNNISIESLNSLTSAITDYRISQKRIKKTPNNPVSSRSHLYIVFEITFDTGKIGYITIVDTAGRESPVDIYDVFIEPKDHNGKISKTNITTILGPTGGIGVVENYMKESIRQNYTAKDIFDILKEGFYINETINHLIYFFNKKNYKKTKVNKQMSLDKYSTTKYYVDPIEEEKVIEDPSQQDTVNNVLTIPIMNYLDNLSKNNAVDEFTPTKFICMVCVRSEDQYCSQIFSSLDFAQQVRSS
jgi:hypothetical protein